MNLTTVTDARGLEAFLRLPFRLYAEDGNWVPPLLSAERKTLDPERNPFWKHAEAAHFLAERDGRPVGRISAIANRLHNETHSDKVGFFGWFESENDPAVANALVDAAGAWLRERGFDRMRGPVNPSMNDPCGLLVDGFNWSPFVLMTYNPAWYARLLEGAGLAKAMDLLAHIIVHDGLARDRVDRLVERMKERKEVSLRPLRLSRLRDELAVVKEVYNSGWEKNWGFVPMTDEEIDFAAADMKALLLPELAWIAEVGGRPAGFAFALPDINHALKKCRGSLFPFGWWHFLKFNLKKIPTFRLVALGVKREYQHLGIGTLFYQRYMDAGLRLGYRAAELSWVLETNDLMNRPIKLIGGKPYKAYRIYEKAL
jgi:GNAT superfamily N-acetyltransferase